MNLLKIYACVILVILLILPRAKVQSGNDALRSQQFRVTIPKRLFISSPSTVPLQEYPGEGAADILFTEESWTIGNNTRNGATVLIETQSAFQHLDNATSKRDAQLEVTVTDASGPGIWSVDVPSATTDYTQGQETARVRVKANGPGSATVKLKVTFLTGAPETLQEGDYTATVVGTIAEN